MPFTAPPRLSYAGLGLYVLDGPCQYVGDRETITIPDGARTDLASVPRLFWSLIPPTGAYEAAAVLHDHLCDELARAHRKRSRPAVGARDTDGLFRRVMRESDVAGPTRWVMWWGVRLGALANPARRAGWWRDAPAVAAITTVVLTTAAAGLLAVHAVVDAALATLT